MDVVDLDELAAEQSSAPRRPRRRPSLGRLVSRRAVAVVAGAVALAVVTVGAVVSSRDPLPVQAAGMRNGPRVGWSSPGGLSAVITIDDARVVTTDDMTIRARRADDGMELWSVDRNSLDLYSASQLRDLPGTPWVLVGNSDSLDTTVAVLLDRDAGAAAYRLELPGPERTASEYYQTSALVSTAEGTLFVLTPPADGGGIAVSRLASPNLDDVVWRSEMPTGAEGFPLWWPYAEERAGYVLLGHEDASWPGRLLGALALADGAPAPWLPDGARFDVFGDVAVIEGEDGRVGVDLRTGAELWRRPGAVSVGAADEVLAEVSGGRLTLLSPRTGAELWSVPTEHERVRVTRWDDIVVAYSGVEVSWGEDRDPNAAIVTAFDLATGARRWRIDLGDPVVEVLRGEGQLVVVQHFYEGELVSPEQESEFNIVTEVESRSGLAAVDPGTGRMRWSEDLGPGWVSRRGTRIVWSPDTGGDEFLR
ncbi:MAG: PQQ-binding-like beta-propeller repeat protein [Tessaracoccus sp.]|uniref:outer membrane protein assembly factor BamB family protein n=1 Tax=Tessaracoccus sp. TaxID=1971211 RepID=UPI001ED29914|nr:PQQ-binding-like beta-propeller repeat protein [Tessaracoccus sp.]MBK7822305.1 PQQ-binding-like beta-propeller repeat protein [Tessaracoccus sp.]